MSLIKEEAQADQDTREEKAPGMEERDQDTHTENTQEDHTAAGDHVVDRVIEDL